MDNQTIVNFLHFNQPTHEQETVLKAMQEFVKEENPDDFLILCGAAGTGKTSITAALIGYLNHLEISYKIAAPTGRAARILGRKSNSTTSTIHSMIYIPKSNSDTGRVTFKLKIGVNPKPIIYIIDEASMVPTEVDKNESLFQAEKGLLFDLVHYIKKANVQNKIILLGDQYQLPPINETYSYALQKEFLEKTFNFIGSSYLLTEVKRQADGSYILANATAIRNAIDEGEILHPIDGKKSKNIYSATDNYVKEMKSKGLENSITIGVSHKANKLFNDLVREKVFGKAKRMIEPGDLLMSTQNWLRNGVYLYNGDHVEVISVDWNLQEQVANLHFTAVKLKLLFSEKEVIIEDYMILEPLLTLGGQVESIKDNELRKQRYIKNPRFSESGRPEDDKYVGALRLMYGHAITCNKAQGGEWKKVFINTWGIPSLKWQYTAVTR